MFFGKFLIVFLMIQLTAFEIGVDGANILACLTSASQSHHIIETTILEELAKRGHNVNLLEKINQNIVVLFHIVVVVFFFVS